MLYHSKKLPTMFDVWCITYLTSIQQKMLALTKHHITRCAKRSKHFQLLNQQMFTIMLEYLAAAFIENWLSTSFDGKFHVPGTVSYVIPSLSHHQQFQDKWCPLCLCSGTHWYFWWQKHNTIKIKLCVKFWLINNYYRLSFTQFLLSGMTKYIYMYVKWHETHTAYNTIIIMLP